MRMIGIAAAILLGALSACTAERPLPAQAPVAPATLSRVVTPLMSGWRFLDGPADVAAAKSGYDDAGWERVSLPHTWNALGEYRLTRTDKTRNRQGEGWYRLTIDGAALPKRQRHFLQFDAVGNVADVWVNGAHVAHHAGAFSRFRVEVTDALRRDGPNLVAVRADNSRPEPGSTTQDVVPLQGDFFIHGGLYRAVSLISTSNQHIDLGDHGGPGVYVLTEEIADGTARVRVDTVLDIAAPDPMWGEMRPRNRWIPHRIDLRTQILDAEGRVVAEERAELRGTETGHKAAFDIPRAHLWDGRADPYRYTVRAELIAGEQTLDRVEQQFGIRTLAFDAERGFFLNGQHLALHGVSRHQDYLGKGWALDHADHARDMALIAEMGANTIRMAHYQHAQDWFDLADEAGMMVWAELPFVNKVAFGDAPASDALIANAKQQMTELIRQNYNHPSVMTWGIGNETDIDYAFGRLGPKADARPLLDTLDALTKQLDPSRPTVIADCCEDTPGKKVAGLPVLAGHADMMGYNRYFGWYYGEVADLGPHLDRLHAAHPGIPISVSEYGAGGAMTQHSDNPQGGPVNAGGRPHPEEYQSWIHERSWPQLAERPYLFASWIWNMFDFASVVRQEGDAVDINDKGLVSFDRKVKKDAFYYYKAQWRDDVPVLHINGRRYADRAYPVSDVRIYSNAPEVRLRLNGRDLGTAPCPGRICVFRQVALDPGANRLEASAGGASDSIEWNAPDARKGLRINVGSLSGFIAADGSHVGSDNWFDGGQAVRMRDADAKELAPVGDARLLTSMREGQFRYAIPLPDGRWRVTIESIETQVPRGLRQFSVRAEGKTVVSGVAPEIKAGRLKRAATSFDTQVTDGVLDLEFGPRSTVAGITIRPL